MDGHGNFRPTYNYTFNSYDRMNTSDIGVPPDDNQSIIPIDYRQYFGNPVFPSSMDMVGPHFAVNRPQSDNFGMSFPTESFYDQINAPVEQSRKNDKASDLDNQVENIHNPFMQGRSYAEPAFSVQNITKSSLYEKSVGEYFRETDAKEKASVEVDVSMTEDKNVDKMVKKEKENDNGETEENQKSNDDNLPEDKNADNADESNVVTISAIKEECITDDENDIDHDEDGGNTSDISDASTIIEDEDEIADKLKKKQNNLVVKFQDKSTRKKPRKQKMPKPVFPKDKKEYTCETCAKVVHSLRALIKHRNLHTENFKCNECNKIFNSEESLKNHDKVHTGFIGKEVCNVCDKTFYDRSSLNKHTLSVHMGIKNFQCEYCHLSFFAKKTYEEHVRVHTGERPFKCQHCPKAYKRIADLNHHVRLHKGEVSHTCEKCGEGFRRVSELNRHMTTKHISDKPKVFAPPVYKSKNCSWCGLVFSTTKALNQHFNTHMDNINASQIGGQNPVAFQHEKVKLIEEMVQELGTNLAGPGISDMGGGSSFLPNGPNIAKDLNFQPQTRMTMNQGLDMTYRSMMKAEPTKTPEYTHEGNGLTANRKEVLELDKNETSDVAEFIGKGKDIEHSQRIFEQSNIELPSEMGEFKEPSDSDSAEHAELEETVVENQNDFVKSEIDDFCDYDQENDDYGGDTDIEDYDYVINDANVMDKKDIQEKIDKMVRVKVEADDDNISDIDGIHNSEDDACKDPDFVPAAEKKSKRKATKPRKKMQKKKKIKTETDATDEEEDNEKETLRLKKKKLEEEDGSMDLDALKCLQCGKYFSKKVSLVLHMNLHRGTYSCEICGKCFATKKSLKTHIDNHEGRKTNTATCNVCDKVFYDASSMNKHVKTVHMDYKPFPCTECDRRFSEHKTLSEHLRVHTGERPFACEVCGKTYKRSSELNFHIRKHSGEVNLNCPECGKGFIRMGQLRQHMLLRHDKERPFRCFLCAKTFPTHAMLKDHQNMHSIQRKHVCEKCGYKFHTKSKLEKHLRRKTDCQTDLGLSVNGMFVCKYCYSEFPTVEERYSHIEEVHKNDKRRTYPCEVCGKQFRRGQALKIHLKIHFQVRDFKCTMCSAAFIQRHHLTQHIATHTGSRPYQCQICLKNFAHSATLYNHMKHH